ncbi:MAG: phage holin family protein [Chloroflexota bacterium]
MAAQLPPTDRQTTTQLFRRIVNGLNGLVDRHVQLVKQELKEELFQALGAGKTLGIGVGIAVVGALVLMNVVIMMIVLGLNELGSWFIPYVGKFLGWIVILILIAVAFFLAYRFVIRGIREIRMSPLETTRATLSEDITWARQLLTRNGK